jgi:hypothetical protein
MSRQQHVIRLHAVDRLQQAINGYPKESLKRRYGTPWDSIRWEYAILYGV